MDEINQLRKYSVRLLVVSPFYLIASLIWVSLLGDFGGTGNFVLHYKSLLGTYPVLGVATSIFLNGFSLLVIAIYISMMLVFYSLIQEGVRFKWLKSMLPYLFVIIAAIYIYSVLLYVPPDGYIVMIFFVFLAAVYTQLSRFNRQAIDRGYLRQLAIPSALANLVMLVLLAIAITWLAVFTINSSSLAQPWLAQSTLFFIIVSTLFMAIASLLTTIEFTHCLPYLKGWGRRA